MPEPTPSEDQASANVVVHYFIDEAGTPTLFGHRGKVLVGTDQTSQYFLLGKLEVAATVVVTGDWPGGELRLDLWPPARPSPDAVLRWRPEGHGVAQGLTVEERAEPADNPNHLHLTVASLEPAAPLVTGNWNEVHSHQTRRLAAKYFLWWSVR